jgi:hypothetical protein
MPQWHFHVTATGPEPKSELGRWFKAMAEAIAKSGPIVSEQETQKRLDRFTPQSESELQRMTSDASAMRLPKNTAETAELEALAVKGPAAVYGWIYGEKSLIAEQMKGQTWADFGETDPIAAARTLTASLKQLERLQKS